MRVVDLRDPNKSNLAAGGFSEIIPSDDAVLVYLYSGYMVEIPYNELQQIQNKVMSKPCEVKIE